MIHYEVLPYIDPQQIFIQVADLADTIFLDSSLLHHHYGRYSFILLNPLSKFTANSNSLATDIAKWQRLINDNEQQFATQDNKDSLPPFSGGLAGYFSYDLSRQLEAKLKPALINDVPDYYLGLYNQLFAFDHIKRICYAIVSRVNGFNPDYSNQMKFLLKLYDNAKTNINKASLTPIPSLKLTADYTKTQYIDKIRMAQEYILNGDIFEINLAQRFYTLIDDNYPFASLYCKLRNINAAPFASFLNLANGIKILSASPERFISITDNKIEARPIKGTAKRSRYPLIDHIIAKRLKNSVKDRAENIMIVDLMRSDLAKLCVAQSIKVTKLCEIEQFTNIHHMVSVIEGELSPDKSILSIIPSCFPAGSVTGAPKIRAMQLIDELEQHQRGINYGSIGYFGFNGNVDLSVAIRTIVCNKGSLSFHAGGAITLGSNPEREYAETMHKAEKLIQAVNDSLSIL